MLKTGGSYQVKNVVLAINACNYLIDLDKELVQQAIDCFNWPGRFEKFGSIYLDGAHNVDGILALKKTIKDQKLEDIVIVFSALSDKDVCEMKALLIEYPLIQVSFDDERLNSDDINYKDILNKLIGNYKNIVVTGSLHFISEVRKYLKENPKIR